LLRSFPTLVSPDTITIICHVSNSAGAVNIQRREIEIDPCGLKANEDAHNIEPARNNETDIPESTGGEHPPLLRGAYRLKRNITVHVALRDRDVSVGPHIQNEGS